MAKLTVAQLIKRLQESPNMSAEVRMGAGTNLIGTATAATDTMAITAHGLVAGDRVRCVAIAGGAAGLTVGNSYYVIATGLTANAFLVSATDGGAQVDITSDSTGVGVAWAKQSVGAGSDPSKASLPADAPGAAAVVPGVFTLS